MPANGLLSPAEALELGVPHAHEYFGVWAIEEKVFAGLVESYKVADLRAHIDDAKAAAQPLRRDYRMDGSVAVIDLVGTLMKSRSSMQQSTSTVEARRQVRAAMDDPGVSGIVLRIDSPGGTVSGTQALADDIAAAGAKKPTLAFIEDLGASAAYWLASQAKQVMAGPSALIGSIGTFSVVTDYSSRAAAENVKVHVVRAGKFKGMGVPGTEITAEQLQEMQRTVDGLNAQFLAGVAAGRGLSADAVNDLADGRVHVAKEAKALKLIDAIGSFDQALERLQAAKPTSNKGRAQMSTAPIADAAASLVVAGPRPATLQELKGSCKGADAAFMLSQLEANATVEQAKDAWIAKQQDLIAAERAAAEQAKAEAAAAAAKKPGSPAVGTGNLATAAAEDSVDAATAWNDLVASKIKSGMPRNKASLAAAKERPDLHRAFVLAANANRAPDPRATRGF